MPFEKRKNVWSEGGCPQKLEEARVSLEKARLRQKIADRHRQQGGSRLS